LGGHDHIIFEKIVKNSLIIKSGTNFKQFNTIRVNFADSKGELAEIKTIENEKVFKLNNLSVYTNLVSVTTDFIPNPMLETYVSKYMTELIIQKAQVRKEFLRIS
jgi:hypothetical protein